jgi:hypothetical protein
VVPSAGGQEHNVTTVEEFLASLADDRQAIVTAVRKVILENLPPGYEEGIQYGMLAYSVPLSVLPDTYNKQPLGYAALGSHKSYLSLYLNNVYSNPEIEAWFRQAFLASGKKLNMGKSCVNFKKLDDLPLDVIGQTIARTPIDEFVATYRAARAARRIGSGRRSVKGT